MAGPLGRLRQRMARDWQLRQLRDERWRFLWDEPPPDEWVSFDCETTGLDTRNDEIVAIGAVRIRGQRIMTSERLELLVRPEKKVLSAESIRIHRLRGQDVEAGLPAGEAVERLLRFIGPRPLVGYYIDFDCAMVSRVARAHLGFALPQPRIEVSQLYYDYRFRQLPPYQQHDQADIDLRFATIMAELGLPTRDAHDALNDAVMAAMAFIKLRQLRAD